MVLLLTAVLRQVFSYCLAESQQCQALLVTAQFRSISGDGSSKEAEGRIKLM